jgi:hypothetical protein
VVAARAKCDDQSSSRSRVSTSEVARRASISTAASASPWKPMTRVKPGLWMVTVCAAPRRSATPSRCTSRATVATCAATSSTSSVAPLASSGVPLSSVTTHPRTPGSSSMNRCATVVGLGAREGIV